MNSLMLESWVLNIIKRINSGQPKEDFKVELKGQWVHDASKAARLLGGHANAALGEDILWLVGVDENKGVVGANDIELAVWYPQVKSRFDGDMAPELRKNLIIPIEDKTVVALLFATDRAPFVVKNPDGGRCQCEVPWREGNRTRSATRSDLIRLLSPLEPLPTVQVLSATLEYRGNPEDSEEPPALWLGLKFYVSPKSERKLVIPFHQSKVLFTIPETGEQISFDSFSLMPDANGAIEGSISKSPYIQATSTELIIKGSGMICLNAVRRYIENKRMILLRKVLSMPRISPIQIIAELRPVNAERSISIDLLLDYTPTEEDHQWRFKPN